VGTALGEVYYQLGRYQQAADELQGRLPSLSGEAQVRALFFLAESYHQLGRRQQAAGTYRQILDRHATSNFARPARYGLAWVRYRRGDLQGALQPFGRVRQGARDSLAMKATYMEGVVRSRLGQPDGALSAFRSVARTWPRGSVADEARYEIGMLLYGRGDHDASAAAFRELLRQHPTSPRTGSAYYWLGNAYLADGASDRALKAYRQAIRRNAAPDSLQQEVRFQQAWTEYENGRFDRAAQRFSALADQAPQTQRGADALFWAADSHYETGNLSSARRLLVRYLENHPQGRHRAAARYALGWTYFKQQRYEPAARAFRQFLRAYRGSGGNVPYEQDARLRLGDCLYALRQYDDAVDAYRQVSGSGADYALFQIGQALNFADRPDEAIDALERLADDYPNSRWREDALYRAGYIHFQQQRYAQARQTYRTVIDAYSDQPIAAEAQYGIGDAYYNAGSFDKAVDAYLTVLRDHPDSPTASEAASSLFFALNASDNAGRAEAVIDSIASENPNSALVEQLRFRRAEAAYQSGDVDRALQLFRSFTRRSTNEALLPQAYYYLGIIYADRETYDEAKTYLRQLVDQYASSDRRPQAALRLGDIHLEQQNYESALEAYRVAAESDRLNDELRAQARYGEGVSLLQLGRSDEAENLLQRILEANRGGPLLASARLGLARIAEQDGRTQRALKLYRAVVDQSDGATGAEALFRLGRLLAAEGRTSGAIRELDRMSALYAGYPEWVARALLEQARAHRQRGETGEAAQLYEQVLQEHAGTRFAETAQEEKQAL
jgi:TolA-binding protein